MPRLMKSKKNLLIFRKNRLVDLESKKDKKKNKIKKKRAEIIEILSKNPWLSDKHVDITSMDEPEEQRVEDKKHLRSNFIEENKGLIRHINKRVEAVADNLESECKNLLEKKETVTQDKRNLIEILEECRLKKEETVMETFEKVNRALDGIFSTLLPGAQARLKPINENSILQEGVELSVAFNGVWKNSLNELSGGQRSLLALSFILAMMKYKPAPIYILDEIDAALDLENTQRIGEMIRKHFRNSQFLIVSLKEQMTYNATVIFRVSNTDGKSKVDCIPH